MKNFLDKIRTSEKNVSLRMQLVITVGIMLFGAVLGVLQKWMDSSASDILPVFFQQLDIRNYFGRLAIWILLATVISVYAKTPVRAAVNTFSYFISMLAGYYIYCDLVLGFLPVTYMMIWIAASIIAFFLAYVCWYAKGEGIYAIIISSVILGILFSQAFLITQGLYMTHFLEVMTWIVGIIILRRKPKEFVIEFGFSIIVALVYQMIFPYWG